MLKYIVEMPPEGCSHERGHTMPFVASEIFNCDMPFITPLFFRLATKSEKEFQEQGDTPVGLNFGEPEEDVSLTSPEKFTIKQMQEDNDDFSSTA